MRVNLGRHAGGRPRKGTLELRAGTWHARITTIVDGEPVRKRISLGTDNAAVARAKLRRLLRGELKPEAAPETETFEQAADRIVDTQEKVQGLATATERRSRLRRYVFPTLGPMPVTGIKAAHVRGVLEAARDAGRSRQTMLHILHDVSSVLGELWRAELLPENVAKRVSVKDILPHREQKRERAVLTDDELVRYLAWQHPDGQHRMAALERQVMACVARMLGGQRTSDLHAARWEDFELPEFTEARVRSEKTGKTRRLHVPEMLRPILADWWTRRGEPKTGLLFPTRRGDRAGQQRIGITHAKAFRRDLRRAFGLEVPERVRIMRSHGTPDTRIRWKPGRQPTARERTLLDGDANTLPVDFHSWRRAFSQALAEAGLNEQQAMALAGHESEEAHRRYLRARDRLRELPIAALPRLGVSSHPWPKLPSGSPLSQYATGDSNARPSAPEADALSS